MTDVLTYIIIILAITAFIFWMIIKFTRELFVWNNETVEKALENERKTTKKLNANRILKVTEIGEKINRTPEAVNRRLKKLGLIEWMPPHNWIVTELGKQHGGIQKEYDRNRNKYVVWTDAILQHPDIICDLVSEKETEPGKAENDYRKKYSAEFRTKDGHYVRSRAELCIDNWLYDEEILHEYERKLPVEENLYSDFYIPKGRIYIEYWGQDNDPQYLSRKKQKQEIYKKYNYSLIEITNRDIQHLDDLLPVKLRSFGIIID